MNSLLWNYCCYQEAQTKRWQRGRKGERGGGSKTLKAWGGGVEKEGGKRGKGAVEPEGDGNE